MPDEAKGFSKQLTVDINLPIGSYTRPIAITTPCGLCNEMAIIGELDNPSTFYVPERIHAQLIWFLSGSLEYSVANPLPKRAKADTIEITMEICSETHQYNNEWPSDVTLWINDHEVGTWTSPGDFGGQRGSFTPSWWDIRDTQYGLLTRWLINDTGAFVNDEQVSGVRARDLVLERAQELIIRLGIKPDARHIGGLNLFGSAFGNYPQDMLVRLSYTSK